MTDEIRDNVKQGIVEQLAEELPGLTKAAQEMVAEDILTSIETSEEFNAAADLAGGLEKEAAPTSWAKNLGTLPTKGKAGAKGFGDWLKGYLTSPSSKTTIGSDIGAKALQHGTKLAIGTTATIGIHNFLKAKKNEELINQYADFQNTLANVAQRNEFLANENSDRIKELGNSIFKFAPTVASDPLVLETVMSNAVHGGGLDPQTVRSLQELEERYYKLREVDAPKTFIV